MEEYARCTFAEAEHALAGAGAIPSAGAPVIGRRLPASNENDDHCAVNYYSIRQTS